jgi:hypothetical protein
MQFVRLNLAGDHAFEHIGEPGLWIDAIQCGGLDQRHCDCPALGAAVTAREERVLSGEGMGSDGALDDVRMCALLRCTALPGGNPGRQLSLQPEALGAGQEATNGLKHFEKRPL